ncbi:helix-turn-helix transcriptional regulator [Pedobacter deserti]|uniref:helix-turn-helix transcriptional regulator n=1 Tax=Pedobacter deserti TaxID=2817382 RepID=UPI00210D94DD|nr:LuxR C-terminal-related transcriptional regulator [Pedobacter sp. SYSU D00382]
MVINNHSNTDSNLRQLLDIKLLAQPFGGAEGQITLEQAKLIAEVYNRIDQCTCVLSDLKSRKSYIYYSALAARLGIEQRELEIDSIWEDALLSRMHPKDVQAKYRLELQYFQLLSAVPVAERGNYEVITGLRARDEQGKFVKLKHRLLYISSADDGSVSLALCLYYLVYDHPGHGVPEGVIVNRKTGLVIGYDEEQFNRLLSPRELQVLQLIKAGLRSKEIADKLLLSINTVNRHRQNILKKLNVTNAMEACSVAVVTGLV